MSRFSSPLCRFSSKNDKSQGEKNKTGLKDKILDNIQGEKKPRTHARMKINNPARVWCVCVSPRMSPPVLTPIYRG